MQMNGASQGSSTRVTYAGIINIYNLTEMKLSKTLLLFVFFLISVSIHAQSAYSSYTADSRIQLHNLRPYTSVFIDSTNKLTITLQLTSLIKTLTILNSQFIQVVMALIILIEKKQ